MCCTYLELARLLELVHIALALERAARREEDVFVVAIDVLNPRRKPSDGVVVDDLLPVTANVRLRYGGVLADVDRDILRTYTELQ